MIQKNNNIGILCTSYLKNVSENFKNMLNHFFFSQQKISLYFSEKELENSNDDFYILIGAQFFRNIYRIMKNKNKKFIIYQLEQLNKIRLDTNLVNLSEKIFDYTEMNRKIYTNFEILYPPFSFYENLSQKEKEKKEYDILFYGCMNQRRKHILMQVKKKIPNINMMIVNNVKGEKLYDLIKKSKIVLNISFYKPAIFEICRINEIIPFGTFIISELNLIDAYTKQLFEDKIVFIENIESNIETLVSSIQHLLQSEQNPDFYLDIINKINSHNKNILYKYII